MSDPSSTASNPGEQTKGRDAYCPPKLTITPLIDEGAAFIAVGAAHLIGEKGLVELYRQAGYKVTAVW